MFLHCALLWLSGCWRGGSLSVCPHCGNRARAAPLEDPPAEVRDYVQVRFLPFLPLSPVALKLQECVLCIVFIVLRAAYVTDGTVDVNKRSLLCVSMHTFASTVLRVPAWTFRTITAEIQYPRVHK